MLAVLGRLAHPHLCGARAVSGVCALRCCGQRAEASLHCCCHEKGCLALLPPRHATSAACCPPAPLLCHASPGPPCRLHFATNMGVAGGLLLLASFGAGRFTVDALLAKKKE